MISWALKWWQKSIYKVMNINEQSIKFINSYFFIIMPKVERYSQKTKLSDFITTNFVFTVWKEGASKQGIKTSEGIHKICHACINRTPPRHFPNQNQRYWHGNSIKIHQESRWFCVKNQHKADDLACLQLLLKLCLLIQFSIGRALMPR